MLVGMIYPLKNTHLIVSIVEKIITNNIVLINGESTLY